MLTVKQRGLLCFIEQSLRENHIAPSYEEAREALGLKSKSSIHRMMQALVDRGYISRLPNRARALEVVRGSDGAYPSVSLPRVDFPAPVETRIPLLGHVTAGVPVVVWENSDRYIDIPSKWARLDADHFALEVRGESMTGAGIFDGDTIMLRSQDTAEDGDIVVVLVDQDETTLKRLRRDAQRGEIVLEAENPDYPDIRHAADRITVQGRLIGLLRRYT